MKEKCPNCGKKVEMLSLEEGDKCPKCGVIFYKIKILGE